MSEVFKVSVSRTYVHETTIEVTANSIEEARMKAVDEINNTVLPISYAVEGSDLIDEMSEGEINTAYVMFISENVEKKESQNVY